MKTQTLCSCCHELIIGEVVLCAVGGDEVELEYCSWECVEHVEEQYQEYLDSCDM